MTISERLTQLQENKFHVVHKALGDVEMDNHDFIRIYDKSIQYNAMCVIDAEETAISTVPQYLMCKDITKEEVWMIGADIALDLYI